MDQNTVFISYRRAISKRLARSLFLELRNHGWDVFLDVSTMDSGDFDQIILNQIGARAHFILLISPDSLARCANQGDWVLREIEEAVRLNRNIVPIVEEGADFAREMAFLPPTLRDVVSKKNALPLTHFYFDAGVEQLRTRFLKAPEYVKLTTVSAAERAEVVRRIDSVDATPHPPPPDPVAAAMARARTFNGTRNRDWQPLTTTFSELKFPEMRFCLVPTGRFRMGSNHEHYPDEKPEHDQTMESPFWIAQYPVTNAQWEAGVQAEVVKKPLEDGYSLQWYNAAAMACAPVVGVTWFMVRDFAAWVGARLPTEREWEYAARGVESWRYPWGMDWNPDIPIWEQNSGGKPALVTTKPEGVSWVGAQQMSGNVWEWTASLYEGYPYLVDGSRERDTGSRNGVRHVLRGGSWSGNFTDGYRAACRDNFTPKYRYDVRGVRLARS